MTVSFRNNPSVIALKQLKPVEEQNAQVASEVADKVDISPKQNSKKGGFVDRSVNSWVGLLKIGAGIKTYTQGFFKGLKNAAYLGAAVVGIDWFTTSAMKAGVKAATSGKKEAAKALGHMLATPFVALGKTVENGAKFIFGSKNVESIFARPTSQTLKMAFIEAPKRVFKKIYKSTHISPVAKIGLPIIAATALVYTTIRSKLNYNEAAAKLEHRYHTEGYHKN